MTRTVFLIDDEEAMRRSVEQWLTLSDCDVKAYDSGRAALADLTPEFNGVVVSDVKMPDIDGMGVLDAVKMIDPDIPVILVTGHGEVALAVEAMKREAYDFLEKPFSPELLLERVTKAQERRTLMLENRALRRKLANASGLAKYLIGESSIIEALRSDLVDLASTNVNVLLLGETGVGKEVIARVLHDFGARSSGPFRAVNCGAIPEDLFESELFGHEAGAFTGARASKIGAFEFADNGTIFLDEITSMPVSAQVKLLRVLEERTVTRVGSNDPLPLNVRLISAANEDIVKAIEEERFREDLYYRINTIELQIPPLRERGDDAILLFRHFVQIAEREFERTAAELTPGDMNDLRSHAWPGNIRELKNVAERFTLNIAGNRTRISDLLRGARAASSGLEGSLMDRMNAFERDVIISALTSCEGNIGQVMELLNVPRRTLNDKMAKYGLTSQKYRI